MLVWVLKPKNLILPAFFICAAHSLMGSPNLVHTGNAVEEKQVHVVRVQPFQRLVEALGQVFGCGGTRFGHQKNFLAGFGIAAEKAAEAFFAQAVAVGLGRVPVVHPPVVGPV